MSVVNENLRSAQMKLLVMDTSDNPSELLIKLITKNKVSVNAHRASEKSELFELLKNQTWDILLLNDDVEDVDPTECIASIEKYQRNTSLVSLVTREVELDEVTNSFCNGVAALVSLSLQDYAVKAILKEFNIIQDKKRNNDLLKRNLELEERCQVLLSSSRDAVAYIHQGMHVYANDSYIQMFKFSDLDSVISTPFLDIVEESKQEELKQYLNDLDSNQLSSDLELKPFAATAKCVNGVEFEMQLFFQVTNYDGESSLQVLVNLNEGVDADLEPKKEVLAPQKPTVNDQNKNNTPKLSSIPVKENSGTTSKDVKEENMQAKFDLSEIKSLFKKSPKSITYDAIIGVPDLEAEIYEIDIKFYEKESAVKVKDIKKTISTDPIGQKIDRWILTQSIPTIAEIYNKGQTLQVIYSPSMSSVKDNSFSSWILELIESCRLGTDALIININEDDILQDKERSINMIESFKKKGIKVCISEYSFNDEMKNFIETHDISFVRLDKKVSHLDIHDDEIMNRLESEIGKLHKHDIRVMVSGVDHATALSLFWGVDVDLLQGEYFQKDDLEFNVESFIEQIAI